MTRHLLVLVLLLELLETETTNVTIEDRRKNNRNQTLTSLNQGNTTKEFYNSSLYNKDLRELESEVKNNESSNFVTEEDESFQEEMDHVLPGQCNYDQLRVLSNSLCGKMFFETMKTIRPEDWCVFERTIRSYNDLTLCLEKLSMWIGCFFPNPTIQDFFLAIHSHYFSNCSREEEFLEDAPEQWVIILMTLVPVTLIPVLVYLVIWKSKEFQRS